MILQQAIKALADLNEGIITMGIISVDFLLLSISLWVVGRLFNSATLSSWSLGMFLAGLSFMLVGVVLLIILSISLIYIIIGGP